MPPFASSDQLGFTGSLLTTLRDSRARLDAFIDDQMEQADAAAAAHEARVAQEQTLVDAQVSNLLEVELERGLNVNNNSGNEDSAVGLAKRREELARQQDGVKQEIECLQTKQDEKEKDLKGIINFIAEIHLYLCGEAHTLYHNAQGYSWKKPDIANVRMKQVT